ncbi:hypothetical protein AGMMS49957_16360 [Synergistales bacterium]|nr:hypothetical protein AGMMS49957_16360 [Synergistales bacterium]
MRFTLEKAVRCEGNKTRAAYNHAERLDERRAMCQAWADWLDGLNMD